MREQRIPVDLFNPGQVFACIGLAELAEHVMGGAIGAFEWSNGTEASFVLQAEGDEPIEAGLEFVRSAEVVALAPAGSPNSAEKWGIVTDVLPPGAPSRNPDPSSPATLAAMLRSQGRAVVLDHWGDNTRRDNVKFWAGAGGYPGVGLLRDALALVGDSVDVADPFNTPRPQSSSFRLDWRRDYVPLGIGFSLNAHGSNFQPAGYPLVEVLAAIGLTHARPQRPERRNKLLYRYAVAGAPLPLPLLRAVLGCAELPFPTRSFRITLEWPGQEGQARCITDVVEEARS